MHRSSRLVALGIAFAITGVFAVAAHAYSISSYKWNVKPVLIFVNPANHDVSATAAEAAVKVGMNAWNGKANFQYWYGGRVSDTATSVDGRNVVIFRNSSNGSAVATTYTWLRNGARFDSDVVVWDGAFHLYTGTSGCSSGAYIEDIAAHELGHVAGINHSSLTDATMYGVYRLCSTFMRTLSSDDIAAIRKRYP